ncbi:MAG TPA: ACP S-malonyltransferase [Thermoanaerobaculia bacterium]|nr:ACP S-malonyltransferase [Thermoanaerobaculia bacterium]
MSAGRLALVFPGQGSQKVGMGGDWAAALPDAAATFAEADAALGLPLSRLCWEGPAEELQLTANQQPAILAVSVAMQRVLAARGVEPALVAGHSLGEYSALVAAGSLRFADALRLVRRRGELMQEAVPVGQGAMAAILGLDAEAVEALVTEAAGDEVCAVANRNAPEQTVIAGHAPAVARAVELARERGARRALLLPVSAPFHSPLMAPARQGLAPLLRATSFVDPRVPVVVNVDAAPRFSGEALRDALERQVDSPVRWVESVRWMAEEGGVGTFLEVGPGAVLSGLIRRIAPDARALAIGSPETLDALLAELPERS